jgi:hypothetical protein
LNWGPFFFCFIIFLFCRYSNRRLQFPGFKLYAKLLYCADLVLCIKLLWLCLCAEANYFLNLYVFVRF